ncbi:hypothetical protein PG994_011448 [Apiospora phragmitis]|uniref:BZIP-type transcription factor n=1 Tax=Apiospora phragmitis TaxID=2905665 RepID=A0ABR1TT08_9PEZI
MSSSSSPQAQSGHGNGQDKSPLSSLNLGFLKTLSEKRTTRDGQPAKRRGPKPDSKPALTRRQELNRQAQSRRTHRERKELYIKALEDEVLRLKEIYSNVSQDKDKLAEENKQLKGLLNQNGIPMASPGRMDDVISNPSLGYTSSASMSGGSYAPGSATTYTPPLTSQSIPLSASSQGMPHYQPQHSHHGRSTSQQHAQQQHGRVDYDQVGVDFVLTARDGTGEPCGHTLMASCPPEPVDKLTNEIPFGYSHTRSEEGKSGQRTWELSKGDLATLLDLSQKLDLDGEITPVMAWGMILAHPRLSEIRPEEFRKLADELKGKVRCYGFGAVMEEFEVRDALNAVLSTKPELASYM